MKKEKFTLTRRGVFSLDVHGPHHCGIAERGEEQTIRYNVAVTCGGDLDSRGFLFEQRNVDLFFKSMKSTKLSCELLARKSADGLVAMVHRENPDCEIRKISVTLSASPFQADMNYTRSF